MSSNFYRHSSQVRSKQVTVPNYGGDRFFRIHRPNHNLDRCRTQFRMVAEMEKQMDEMQGIIEQYR